MIRKVLVYIYDKQSQAHTVEAAAEFAKLHDAELTGVFVKRDFMAYSLTYGEYPLNLAQSLLKAQKKHAIEAKKQFADIVASIKCEATWHVIDEYERKPNPSFYADYIFVGQPSPESDAIFSDFSFIDRLIVETGLPLIIIPNNWAVKKFGLRPVLGWKETREAVSVVRHTLPLLRQADQVDIVTVVRDADKDDADVSKGFEISDYLKSHSVSCRFCELAMQQGERDESESLMRHVQQNDLDSIIIGGYGHLRFRETILGGVTRGLLRNSPVPLVLAH